MPDMFAQVLLAKPAIYAYVAVYISFDIIAGTYLTFEFLGTLSLVDELQAEARQIAYV